ncbi:unnamed protein product, partial [Mesorhabditis spiculigera]
LFLTKRKRSIKRFDLRGLTLVNLRGRVSSGLTAVASSSSMTQIDETSPKQTHQNTPTTTRSKFVPFAGWASHKKHTEYYVRCREVFRQRSCCPDEHAGIIRMDKLINEAPADPAKRKGKLTNPVLAAAMQDEDEESKCRGLLRWKNWQIWRSAPVAISTMIDWKLEGEPRMDAAEQLRVCVPCLSLLEKRELQMEARNPPALVSIYERLIILLNEISNLSPAYAKMASSINTLVSQLGRGDPLKIARKQQEIDLISKSIEGDETENMGFQCDFLTCKGSRRLRNMLNWLSFTAERWLDKWKSNVQSLSGQRLRLRGQSARTHRPRSNSCGKMTQLSSFIGRSVDDGWTPELSHSLHNNPFAEQVEQKHPLEEQRDIIKGYLSQAAAAGRLEEVEMLERNLRDLEIAMREHQIHTP